MTRPDFIIIGAMKCGTTTLQEQLDAQPGIFMTTPKEPNFFSDDSVYARGMGWYEALFDAAPAGALTGEASTHYTKLPTYPLCIDRLHEAAPQARLIYMTRDPFSRLVSHYVHEWTMRVISCGLTEAIDRHPELIAYSRYGMQIAPFIERFGRERILLMSLEGMMRDPQAALDRVGAFIGAAAPLRWRDDLEAANVSADRVRRLPMQDLLVHSRLATALRRALVPKSLRNAVKAMRRMPERPKLSDADRARLAPIFAQDRARLAALFPDVELDQI